VTTDVDSGATVVVTAVAMADVTAVGAVVVEGAVVVDGPVVLDAVAADDVVGAAAGPSAEHAATASINATIGTLTRASLRSVRRAAGWMQRDVSTGTVAPRVRSHPG
jgi:hypothetical protein